MQFSLYTACYVDYLELAANSTRSAKNIPISKVISVIFHPFFSTISSRDKPKKMFFYRGQSKRLISWLIHQNKLQYCVDLHWDSCKAGEQTILHNTHFSLTIPLSIKHLFISIVKCHTCTPFPSLSLFSNLVTSLSCVFPSWSVLFFFFFFKNRSLCCFLTFCTTLSCL